MSESTPDRPLEAPYASERRKRVPGWVKAFFVWHVYAMAAWSLPPPPPSLRDSQTPFTWGTVARDPVAWALLVNGHIKDSHASPLFWYMNFTGLWQFWDMFAPNPTQLDIWMDGVVTYQDGSTRQQPYPRMASLPIPQKYAMERFRKYVERVNPPEFDAKKPALAQWLAAQAPSQPENPPVSVELRRRFRIIRPYPEKTPEEEVVEVIGVYTVDQDRLRRVKGW